MTAPTLDPVTSFDPAQSLDPATEGRPASVLGIMKRGWHASPELREGIWGTIALAMVGAAGRVVIPVLVQQVIDKGFNDGSVDVARVLTLSLVGAAIAVIATIATMFAARRLARSGEHALFGLRTRAFRHIHRLSIAHHAEERRGALVSRVTSDVETLSQFFKWGGIAWVVNGLVIFAVLLTMFVFNWKLALGGAADERAAAVPPPGAAEAAHRCLRPAPHPGRRAAHRGVRGRDGRGRDPQLRHDRVDDRPHR